MAHQLPASGWFEPPGLERPEYPSHIHYVHVPPPLDPSKPIKIAAFALNHVLVRPSSGQRFANLLDPEDWTWHQGEHTRSVLRDLQQAGWTLVVFGNELGVSWDTARKVPVLRSKIEGIAQSLDIPIRFMLALKKDSCRVPDTEMFDGLDFFYERNSVKIDRQNSFFCGNAAGRPGDYADSDRQFAVNVGVHFVLPEQCFSPNFIHQQLPGVLATPILLNPLSPAIAHGALQRMPRNPDDSAESETELVAPALPSSVSALPRSPPFNSRPRNSSSLSSSPPPPLPRPSSSYKKGVPSALIDDSDRPTSRSLGMSKKRKKGQLSSSSRNVSRRTPKSASKKPRRRASTSSSSTGTSSSSSGSETDSESTASSSSSSESSDEKSRKRKKKQPVASKQTKRITAKGKEREMVDLDSDEPLSFQRSVAGLNRKGEGAALEEKDEKEEQRKKKGKGKGKEGK